jgi:light-regulated signal transduction histidine kinase (bacteriophytochrome)
LRRIRTATQRMGQLIDDLLTLSRVIRSDMHREAIDLSKLASYNCTLLQQSHPERQVEFKIQPGVIAQGDNRLLQVVMENLFNNAWKFTAKKTHATIEFGTMASQNGAGEDAEVIPTYFVRDNGVGFDMAYMSKLFSPFQRLHSVSEFPGNGIGLATVQRIVHRHGGRLWAEGELGEGATFYFTLATTEIAV